ncbi:MAG: FAD:protein FMN transferase [Actinomycetota bacterium]|nr:FAD:protein FMN transferase [Actinomycetota bacterium]
MKRVVFPAMGTSIDVTAPTRGDIGATRQLFEDVERLCSRFLPESELTRINDDPGVRIPISPEMARVLQIADRARSTTDGLVDVGVGGAVRAWGYDRTFTEVAIRHHAAVTERSVEPEWSVEGTMLTRSPGTTIDLGGVAKGWTCDLAVERGIATVVSAGGDVRSSDPDATVEIIDPWDATATTIRLGIGALATSSVSRRRWRVGGAQANHLIDPRTMRPTSSPVLSATAITATAVEAEAAAKAILLRGADALAWADRQPWIVGALVVWLDGSVYGTTGMEIAA